MNKKPQVLLIGQVPPPYHGQAVVTAILMNHDWVNIDVFKLPMHFSALDSEVGKFKLLKILELGRLIYASWKFAINNRGAILYYPPASPNLIPLLRDTFFLFFVRPLFKNVVFHFHAGGLPEYLVKNKLLGLLAKAVYGKPTVAVEIAECGLSAGDYFNAKHKIIVKNGLCVPGKSETLPVLQKNEIRGLFVGTMRRSKGVFRILETLKILKEDGRKFFFEFVGQWHCPNERKEFRDYLRENDLAEYVTESGLLKGDGKWIAYSKADFFFFPSSYSSENFPLVLIEAMAMSLPIISSRWRGIPEIVIDGEGGYLCEIDDLSCYAKRIKSLSDDFEMRIIMGKKARSIYEEKYTEKKFISQMEAVFSVASEA